ncbi:MULTISPECIES: GtrA family protein [unclassified Modestobacter]
MTCPSLLRRSAISGAPEGPVLAAADHGRVASLVHMTSTRLRQDDTGAQFTRFVVVGGLSSALYATLFIALGGLGDQTANLSGAIASTLLANELHRRLTFHAGGRVSWFTAQWEGGGLAGIGLVATSLTLAGVHALLGDIGTGPQLCLIAAVTGLIGLIRFIALRSWVFPAARDPQE